MSQCAMHCTYLSKYTCLLFSSCPQEEGGSDSCALLVTCCLSCVFSCSCRSSGCDSVGFLKASCKLNCLLTALGSTTSFFFFFGWCYSYGPQQGPDRQQKKEERGLKQRRKQKEAAQGDPEPKKGSQEKEKKSSRVQR